MKYLKYLILIVFIVIIQIINKNNLILEVNTENNLIDIKNSSIIYSDNKSIFKAILINNSNNLLYINNIEIVVYDVDKNIIDNFIIDINKNINEFEKIKLEKTSKKDLSDATSFDYIIN